MLSGRAITDTAVQIIYSEGGSLGVYRRGDYWGTTIHVLFSGVVKYFDNFYPDTLVQRDEVRLNPAEKNAIWELFESGQYNIPAYLPNVNLEEDTSATLKISYRYSPAAFFKEVQINSFGGRAEIPHGFFDFVRRLKSILFNVRDRN